MYRDNLIPSDASMQCSVEQRMIAPTMRERFLQQKGELTQRLANINAAIEALDANPTFEKVLDVVQKVY